jgi:integrase
MEVQKRSLTIGEAWILPSPKDSSRASSRHLVKNWWYRAEKAAELDHVKGLGWHSLRRKFATELKEIPLKDLCELGGWKSHETILKCYQSADEDTMREALKTRKTLRVVGAK